MVKVNIAGHELEFEKELIETFENEVLDPFAKTAPFYILSDFKEKTVAEVFLKHTEKEIKDAIIAAARSEIALYEGKI